MESVEKEERTVYIIKPEGMKYACEIREMIREAGKITGAWQLILPEWVPKILYPKGSSEQHYGLGKFFGSGISEIGIVIGEGAIEALVRISGSKTDPLSCEPGTIRKRFGDYPEMGHGIPYYRNCIHRSRTGKESLRDQNLCQTLSSHFHYQAIRVSL